jgi:hypothetical protein
MAPPPELNVGVPDLEYFTPQHIISPGTPAAPEATKSVPKLFQPLTIRGTTLRNRVLVAPMCQYSTASHGPATGALTDYHIATLGHYALKGAALVMVRSPSSSLPHPNPPGRSNRRPVQRQNLPQLPWYLERCADPRAPPGQRLHQIPGRTQRDPTRPRWPQGEHVRALDRREPTHERREEEGECARERSRRRVARGCRWAYGWRGVDVGRAQTGR